MAWHAAVMIAYDGREFTGSQRQPDKKTVEDECIRALKKVHAIESVKDSRFRAASRTDRGVSALCNVIVFETEFKKDQLLQALERGIGKGLFLCICGSRLRISPPGGQNSAGTDTS